MSALLVETVGPLATIQDLGRPGHGALGVTTSGAADRRALRLANRLAGNDEDAPAVEVLLGGLALRADGAVTVAVTGAATPLMVGATSAEQHAPLDLRDGDLLTLGMPFAGLRSYVAVRGGLDVERLFGSASTDPTSGLGPPALAVGQRLQVGGSPPVSASSGVDAWGPVGPLHDDLVLRAVPGPRDDWFTPEALSTLAGRSWTVTSDSDRVGIRLAGARLERARHDELPSEGVVRGAIQVPPSGEPLVFLADHPTTGGYPVIAVVLDSDTDRLGQVRPGERIRFRLDRTGRW